VVHDKKIILGVSGGIAAIKVPLLLRALRKENADVHVIMTKAAREFITPLSLSVLSQHPVICEMFTEQNASFVDASTWHIHLALSADAMLIAPATANILAKLAHGIADDALTTLALSLRCPLLLCPSMDDEMWKNTITQKNISLLQERGNFILFPEAGELASGLVGMGRLPETEVIMKFLEKVFSNSHRDFVGTKILVTAGPTYEFIDPVRFIGNRSSGKMGFALATASQLRGGDVTLISGPTHLQTPKNVHRVNVESAEEMMKQVIANFKESDIVIMAAAVSDFSVKNQHVQKIKRERWLSERLFIELESTKDILQYLGEQKKLQKKKAILVGFALETENEIENAKKKIVSKHLDMIVCNSAREQDAGFYADTNRVTIISKNGKTKSLPLMEKFDVANEILNSISSMTKNP
jgi:phosphopantothenoylcysteine decarboxylase/phosphopantothenate--cysteine ligase